MFIGEHTTQLGEKNRVLIPKILRDEIEENILFLTRGYEKCLLMVDRKRWESLIKEINKKPLFSLNVRDTKRYVLGGTFKIELDSQGRFVLPEELIHFAELKQRIVFLGVGEWIEIWDEAQWKQRLDYLSKNVTDLLERISD